MRRRDLARARDLVTESHRIHERRGDRWGQAQTIGTLGAIERDSGNEARAYELIAVSLTTAREAGVRWWSIPCSRMTRATWSRLASTPRRRNSSQVLRVP
jgi:hypothetical protein